MTKLNIRWDRYALIAELADRLKKINAQFGKTMLQKLVYLLQEAFDLNMGYSFELYTYGPFCTQLLIDLDQVEALHGVKVTPVSTGYGGYKIEPGDQIDFIREKAASQLNDKEYNKALDEIIAELGAKTAADLELRSTIIFVAKDHERRGETLSLKNLHDIVMKIKPKFTWGVIWTTIEELSEEGYINLSDEQSTSIS